MQLGPKIMITPCQILIYQHFYSTKKFVSYWEWEGNLLKGTKTITFKNKY